MIEKISKYYLEATKRAESRTSSWSAINRALTFFCTWPGICFLIVKELLKFQHHYVPNNVFLSSWTQTGAILIVLPVLFMSMPLGMMVSNCIMWCIPPARRVLQQEEDAKPSTTVIVSVVTILVFLLLLSFVGVYKYFYVNMNGVTVRTVPWDDAKQYKWSDVAEVYTDCSGNNSSQFKYALIMKDRMKVDIYVDHFLNFLHALDKIKPYLKAQRNIVYDGTDSCFVPSRW